MEIIFFFVFWIDERNVESRKHGEANSMKEKLLNHIEFILFT